MSTPVLSDATERRVRESFAKQTLMQTLGARIIHLSSGECRIACTVSDAFGQQHGFVHAAVLMALADTAGGYAAFTATEQTEEVVTSELKLNFSSRDVEGPGGHRPDHPRRRTPGRVRDSGARHNRTRQPVLRRGAADDCEGSGSDGPDGVKRSGRH